MLNFYSDSNNVEFHEGLASDHETPMMWRERKLLEKKAYSKELIVNDPNVKDIVDAFDGYLIEKKYSARRLIILKIT